MNEFNVGDKVCLGQLQSEKGTIVEKTKRENRSIIQLDSDPTIIFEASHTELIPKPKE